MADVPYLEQAIRGTTSNGVPFLALPPEGGREAVGLVVLWHGADPPRSEEALAAAVPMPDLAVWRVYLGMPLYGSRAPEGGFEEVMRRGAEDAVTLAYYPSIQGAVDELPGALDDVRARLGVDPALPLGVFGFSQGGAAALLAVSSRSAPFRAAVTYGGVIDFPSLVNFLASFYGISYEWTDERRALAEQLNSAHRAPALAESGAALRFGIGADDPLPLREPAEHLAAAVRAAGGTAEIVIVPDVAHGFVDEPGQEAAAQGPQARTVDEVASEWFRRHLAAPAW